MAALGDNVCGVGLGGRRALRPLHTATLGWEQLVESRTFNEARRGASQYSLTASAQASAISVALCTIGTGESLEMSTAQFRLFVLNLRKG